MLYYPQTCSWIVMSIVPIVSKQAIFCLISSLTVDSGVHRVLPVFPKCLWQDHCCFIQIILSLPIQFSLSQIFDLAGISQLMFIAFMNTLSKHISFQIECNCSFAGIFTCDSCFEHQSITELRAVCLCYLIKSFSYCPLDYNNWIICVLLNFVFFIVQLFKQIMDNQGSLGVVRGHLPLVPKIGEFVCIARQSCRLWNPL